MNDRELMQMALDALMTCREDWIFDGEDERPVDTYDEEMVSKAFKALRAALAQPEQEPVAWRQWVEGNPKVKGDWMLANPDVKDFCLPQGKWQPLYTAPPQREWQGLTDEEIEALRHIIDWTAGWSYGNFARAIEAKLKEKNSGV